MSVSDAFQIRAEDTHRPGETAAIRSVNEAAFGGVEEADLVDKLRIDGDAILSLVAEQHSSIVAHILFSRMWIKTSAQSIPAVALAPLAVQPDRQRQGIGERMVRHGLALLRERGERIVIVVGHPEYYPRFGFSTAKAKALESPFPAEVFMAMELSHGALADVIGTVVYPAAFGI